MLFLLTAFSLECDCKITNYFRTGKKNFTGSAEGAVWGTHTNHVFSNIGIISQYNHLKTSNKTPPAPYPLRIRSECTPWSDGVDGEGVRFDFFTNVYRWRINIFVYLCSLLSQ